MPFYNLVYNYDPSEKEHGYYRQALVVCPDRETSDLFFRFIQDQMQISEKAHFKSLRHLSPQMWTWAGSQNAFEVHHACEAVNLGTAKGKREHLEKLQGRVFVCNLSNENTDTIGPAILPRFEDLADQVSGNVFCIRNKRAPDRYWLKADVSENNPGKKPLQPSNDQRSRFKIEISSQHQAGTLMVDDDDVKMFLVHDGVDYPIMASKDGRLTTNEGDKPLVFRFGRLLNGGFLSDYGPDNQKYIWYTPGDEKTALSGEIWELC
ncbi:hypothetical protein BDW62DRAFT_202855 [Aspergillus aurantiobrunneus]